MKHYLLVCFALGSQLLFAGKAELLQQLSNINSYWNLQPELPDNTLRQFGVSTPVTYHDWITTHLMLVEHTLRGRDVSHLNASQKANRTRLLNELNAYWRNGVYPVNDYLPYKKPVFIDRKGTHCAVGYLMQQSGYDVLAQTIHANEKFAYVHEIKTAGVTTWANEYGFTMDELAWIQPTYSPNTVFAPVGSGTNGPVNVLVPNYSSGGLFIAGNFDTIGNTPCTNIGLYKNGQLGCYGGGVTGEVIDLYLGFNELFAAGEFVNGGVVYPLAVFSNSAGVWNYMNIPTVPGTIGKAVFSGGSGYKLELVVSNPSTGKDEIWYLKTNNVWERQAVVNGVINDIEASYYGRLYVGSFDSVMVSRANQSDTLVLGHNIVVSDYESWSGLANTEVSDTVLVAKVIGSAIYFGGTCSDSAGRSNVCLTRYLNGIFQPVFLSTWFTNWTGAVYDVQLFDNHSLMVAGEFDFSPTGGTGTENIALYDLGMNYLVGYGMFNDKINTVVEWNDNWYFGGDFTADLMNPTLPYLAQLDMTSSIGEHVGKAGVQLYPNPTSAEVNIMVEKGEIGWVAVYDLAGREMLFEQTDKQKVTASLTAFDAGVYLIKVSVNGVQLTSRLVKN